MSKRTVDVLSIVGLAASGLAIYVLPVVRYAVVAKSLGMPAVTLLLLTQSLVTLALHLHPLRSWSWYPGCDIPATTLVRHELLNAAAATLLLTLTAPLWPGLFGVDAPLWMFVPVALRLAGLSLLTAFLRQGRVLAIVAATLDGILLIPLGLLGRSLESVVFAWTTTTLILVIFVAYSPLMPKVASMLERNVEDRWRVGTWLRHLSKNVQAPVFAVAAGIGMLVPLIAATTLASLMLAPFLAVAASAEPRSIEVRLVRGCTTAALGAWFVHACGPRLFQLLLPDSFGTGTQMHTLAWAALATIPLALRATDERASERRMGAAGLVTLGVLVLATALAADTGCLWAIAMGPVLGAAMGLCNESDRFDLQT